MILNPVRSKRDESSFQTPENGSSSGTPVTAMSATLRVTNVRPCTLAVAASRPSIKGNGLGIPRSAQASATGSSMGRTRPPSPHLQKPPIEGFGLLRIAPPFQLDTMADFGEHEHARPNVIDWCARNPMDNVWMGAVALADFGNDVRVQQKFHRSTRRQPR